MVKCPRAVTHALMYVAWLSRWSYLLVGGSMEYHPGHLKPFGLTGPFEIIDEVYGYPTPRDFFQNYVNQKKPLKMKKAMINSPAFTLWSDSYFLSLESLNEVIVSVENSKLEDRQKPIQSMTFAEFLTNYNTSNNYLVTSVPAPISCDVFLPFPLQCPEIYDDMLLANIMWMSSGDTASVVHTDSVDNIICSLRGIKQVVLVDPDKYSKQVVMEHPDEGYSDIDVKKVDYTKHFGLFDVTYHATNITPGDCLFIPFQWIHQVVSFNSNVAINVWWDHHLNDKVNLDACRPSRDHPISLDKVTFHRMSAHFKEFKSELMSSLSNDISNTEFYNIFVDEKGLISMPQTALNFLDQIFEIIDEDNDGIATENNVKKLSKKDWLNIERHYNQFLEVMESKRIKTEL